MFCQSTVFATETDKNLIVGVDEWLVPNAGVELL
jgi:hypothetical protein